MSRFASGTFIPKHPEKYNGVGKIQYRSSWECHFMLFLDSNPNVIQWSSESIRIPYKHPFTGRMTTYVPDFLIVYLDRNGKQHVEMIEIKPHNQSVISEKKARGKNAIKLAQTVAINQAKWVYAKAWCKQQGITFRIVTEQQLFMK
jgi:hypothetical protein